MSSTPDYHRPEEPKTLHVYSEGLESHQYRIMDQDKQTALFNVETHYVSRPSIVITRAIPPTRGQATGPIVGTATIHLTSSDIEMTVNDRKAFLSTNSPFTAGHQWYSPAFGTLLLKWKADGSFTHDRALFLEGQKDKPIARFVSTTMSIPKMGKILLLHPDLETPETPKFDEVVISAIVEMEATRRKDNVS